MALVNVIWKATYSDSRSILTDATFEYIRKISVELVQKTEEKRDKTVIEPWHDKVLASG